MGIVHFIAEAIIREHKYRPITGDVLLLGRQLMTFAPEYAADMIRANGLVPAVPVDDGMIDRRTRGSEGNTFIRDDAFFRLLGVPTIRALDNNDYEGAELIHDLNYPIPAALEQTADFILDGSTLDNLFSPSTALQSVARMLRPGGRFLAINMAGIHSDPYTVMAPFWFVDFFAVNRFSDCRVYVMTHGERAELNVYAADPTDRRGKAFMPTEVTGIMVFAEKDSASTWEVIPSQRHYSRADEIDARVEAGRRFGASGRPELLMSIRPKPFGLRRMAKNAMRSINRTVEDFKLVDPEGRKVSIPPPTSLTIARALRRFTKD